VEWFLWWINNTILMVMTVGDFDTMDCAQHLLLHSEWSKEERPRLLPHLPLHVGQDAAWPNLDHTFSPQNCQRKIQNRWQGHRVWTSWSRKQLVSSSPLKTKTKNHFLCHAAKNTHYHNFNNNINVISRRSDVH